MTPLDEYLAGRIPPGVAIMRLVLAGAAPGAVLKMLADAASHDARLCELSALAHAQKEGLDRLAHMVRSGASHGCSADPAAAIDASRAMFDRLVRISPEGSVAAYSLGDADLLAEATAELCAWLRQQGLLRHRPRILDLGCGIGRLTAALADEASAILGIDASANMIAEAQARHPRLCFRVTSGRDLGGVPDGGFDLVLAVDVFPYLVLGGLSLAEAMLREAYRVLRPRADLLILNFTYRDAQADRRDLPGLADAAGFDVLHNGERAFASWDGLVFWLRRR